MAPIVYFHSPEKRTGVKRAVAIQRLSNAGITIVPDSSSDGSIHITLDSFNNHPNAVVSVTETTGAVTITLDHNAQVIDRLKLCLPDLNTLDNPFLKSGSVKRNNTPYGPPKLGKSGKLKKW
jgi:Transcriptional accessory protein